MLYQIPNNIQQMNSNTDILTVKDHHIINKSRIISVHKLCFRELNSFFVTNVEHQPTSNIQFGKLPNEELDFTNINILLRSITINSYLRNFQYKIL